MKISQEQYEQYLKYCNIITSGNNVESEDLLHDVLMKLMEKNIPDERLNDNFVFMIIRNHFLNNKTREKVRQDINCHSEFIDDIFEYHELDFSTLIMDDKIFQDKLNIVEKVINKLPQYEKKLFILHFIKGISQRKISKATGIGIMPIWYKITKLKNSILQAWQEEENQNQ